MASKKNEKNEGNYSCEKCAFVCWYLSDYDRHISTRKHKMLVNASNTSIKHQPEFNCICGKNYKHDSSYYKHKKVCIFIEEKEEKIACSIYVCEKNSSGKKNIKALNF